MKHRFINVGGRLMDLSRPQVMGILNATTESFYEASRTTSRENIVSKAQAMIEASERYGVTLMEAMKSTLSPNFLAVKENLTAV